MYGSRFFAARHYNARFWNATGGAAADNIPSIDYTDTDNRPEYTSRSKRPEFTLTSQRPEFTARKT